MQLYYNDTHALKIFATAYAAARNFFCPYSAIILHNDTHALKIFVAAYAAARNSFMTECQGHSATTP